MWEKRLDLRLCSLCLCMMFGIWVIIRVEQEGYSEGQSIGIRVLFELGRGLCVWLSGHYEGRQVEVL
jgi:hypothetical protein